MFGKQKSKAWKCLKTLQKHFAKVEMRDLFAADRMRAEKYSVQLDNMLVDYSKNRVDDKVMQALFALARERGLTEKIKAMFNGEKINQTENRATY